MIRNVNEIFETCPQETALYEQTGRVQNVQRTATGQAHMTVDDRRCLSTELSSRPNTSPKQLLFHTYMYSA